MDTSGRVVQKYDFGNTIIHVSRSEIWCLCLSEERVFEVFTNGFIAIIDLNQSGTRLKMNMVKPPGHISNIVGITVLKKDILLLSVEATVRLKEQGYQVIKGKIYEYNIITQQVDIKVPKIDDPSKV